MLKDLMMLKNLPQLTPEASYGLIFLVGLLTSFHCVGMCGGLVMTSCITGHSNETKEGEKVNWFKPSLLYNLGRIISYTLTGAIVGGLGQVISLQGRMKGVVPLVGGLFMILMGINLLGICPKLQKYLPHMPVKLAIKVYGQNNYNRPFYIGLLTGLMPCGPLQILQMYALGTASAIKGALSMGTFAMGTVPLLFLFGAINTVLTKKGARLILKVSSMLVIVMGISMTLQGVALAGINVQLPRGETRQVASLIEIEEGYQVIRSKIGEASFPDIVVVKGIPVRWILEMSEENFNQCNKAIVIPKYNLEKAFNIGENSIEFVPTETGDFIYTCWMGMIKAHIRVVENESDLADRQSSEVSTNNNDAAHSCNYEGMDDVERVTVPKEKLVEEPSNNTNQIGNRDSIDNQIGTVKSDAQNQPLLEEKLFSEAEKEIETLKDEAVKKAIEQGKTQEQTVDTDKKIMEQAREEVVKTELEIEGYLQDKHCFGCITPEADTTFCLQMKECMASGYGLVSNDDEGKSSFYIFDEIGQRKASALLKETTRECGVKIKITGYFSNGKLMVVELIESQ